MPTVNQVLGGLLDNAIKNPRTTISGILTGLIGLIPTLLAGGIIHGKRAGPRHGRGIHGYPKKTPASW